MTPDEKIQKIKELELGFFARIDEIKKEYQQKMRAMTDEIEKKKIEDLKKELGM